MHLLLCVNITIIVILLICEATLEDILALIASIEDILVLVEDVLVHIASHKEDIVVPRATRAPRPHFY